MGPVTTGEVAAVLFIVLPIARGLWLLYDLKRKVLKDMNKQ